MAHRKVAPRHTYSSYSGRGHRHTRCDAVLSDVLLGAADPALVAADGGPGRFGLLCRGPVTVAVVHAAV